jgi:hypothetical protein
MRRWRGFCITCVPAAIFQQVVHAGQERAQLHRQLAGKDLMPFMECEQPVSRCLSADQIILRQVPQIHRDPSQGWQSSSSLWMGSGSGSLSSSSVSGPEGMDMGVPPY